MIIDIAKVSAKLAGRREVFYVANLGKFLKEYLGIKEQASEA